MTTDLVYRTATELAGLIRARAVSPVAVVQAYLARIDRWDGALRAYVTVCRERALDEARAALQALGHGAPVGPLHGVPFAVKDQFDTAGVRTTSGSRLHADRVPAEDATVVARLRAAGGILLGKLNLTEFALGGTLNYPFGQPRNPWDQTRETGGSSSGSGIAAAAALAAATLGEDTGGSVRSPASWCGAVGLRPTWGLVPRSGCVPVAWSMDAPGPLTRSVEDAALLLSIIAGPDGRDRWLQPVRTDPRADLERGAGGLSIGVVTRLVDSPDTAAEVRAAVRAAAETLRALGARVEDVDLPLLPIAGAVFMALADGEAAAWHHATLATRGAEYDPGTRRRLVTAALLPTTLAQQAARARAAIRAQVWDALVRFDVLLAPTGPTAAPPIAAAQAPIASRAEAARRFFNRRSYTTPASLAGVPALSLPCGFTAGGLPIGLQLIGRRFDEATLLRAARAYERATDWRARRPPLPG
ncbi:MAG: amidase [Candidatus Rokuibacteriota bacterium]|jgi:aspartyl-tRNA(Asn)/glutamyl-tRNA(Gln) amidotransferase subunit A